jgi:hypothetical protein
MTMARRPAPEDTAPYVPFGDVARQRLHEQCQYASRYLEGELGDPDLGSDLRWYGDTADYHGLQIHQDDVEEFVRRVRDYRRAHHIGWWEDD